MKYMFSKCTSLISLNLSSFSIPVLKEAQHMFSYCESLEYLNVMNFYKVNGASYNFLNIFLKISDYLVYCISPEVNDKDHIKSLLLSKKCSVNDCSSNWKSKRKKTIINSDICINDCYENNNYEYNYYCYPECPIGTKISLEKEYLCESIENINSNNNSLLEKNETISYNNTSHNHLIMETENGQDLKIFQDSINNLLYKFNNGEFDSIILSIIKEIKDDYIIKNNNTIIQITSLNKQNNKEYENLSSLYIDKECENTLKIKYNINMNDALILFKYDYYIPGIKIPFIGYEIFHPITKKKLDLKYCENNNIKLNLPVIISEDEIYKYDPNNDFYKDICHSFTNEKGVDVTLYDRKKEYNYHNMSICPKNCIFNEYNNLTKKILCECNQNFNNSILLLEDIINTDKLLNNFMDIKTISNIGIIKCFKKIITSEGLKSNIGSYILLLIIVLLLIGCILFYFKGYQYLSNIIDDIITFKKVKKSENKNIINKKETMKKNKKIILSKKIIKKRRKKNRKQFKRRKLNMSNNKSSTRLDIKNQTKFKINDNGKNIITEANKVTEILDNKKQININNNYEINSFSYEKAIKNDKISVC